MCKAPDFKTDNDLASFLYQFYEGKGQHVACFEDMAEANEAKEFLRIKGFKYVLGDDPAPGEYVFMINRDEYLPDFPWVIIMGLPSTK
jgi:hypothetical protein